MAHKVARDERREQLVAVATAIIAQHGFERATVREVAAAAGHSTKVVSHYFTDKRELLLLVYRAGAERSRNRLMAARLERGDDVLACAEALLPLDEERRVDWAIVLAFWSTALTDPAFQREQRHRVGSARQFLGAVIENAVINEDLPAHIDAEQLATEMLTVISGIAVQVMFDPARWSPGRQRSMIRSLLRRAAVDQRPATA